MNFFRKRTKRNISPDQAESKQQCVDDSRSRRHSYFSMRRRDLAAQTVTSPAMVAKLLSGDDSKAGAKKSMQRRSIPGLAYLVSRHSIMNNGSGSGATEVAVPEAAMHRGTSLERSMSGGRGRGARRSSDCGGCSDDSSGGDSDDTLTTKDPAASDSAPAARRQSAGRVPPTICGGSAMPGTASADCAAAAPVSTRRSGVESSGRTSLFLGSTPRLPRAGAAAKPVQIQAARSSQTGALVRSRQGALATMEGNRLLRGGTTVFTAPRQRRQQLNLSRLRSGTSSGVLTSTIRSTLLNLSTGYNHHADESAPKKTTVRFGKKRSAGTLSKLSLAPQPTPAEQARMDAWTADDDDFSADEYDLSGVYFELPSTPSQLLPNVNTATSSGTAAKLTSPALPDKAEQNSTCATPGSRLSSTSTVVEECTLSPEQYQWMYRCSAHKMQWPGRGRGMSSMIHVKNIMAKASECYVVVSGGRRLDVGPKPRDMFSGMYLHDSAPPAGDLLGGGPYPVRSRSVACMQQLLRRPQPDLPGAVPPRRRSLDDSRLGMAVPTVASGYDILYNADLLYNVDLLGASTGDLVSLAPACVSGDYNSTVPVYRPYRRRRAGRRTSGHFMPAFAPMSAVSAVTA
ncbi:hypothetical protein IWW56_001051 [Coemansia sp. RSA 2131]|nr:hypothetical protein IWW56_001051 [Coemansia sp. RSA 2131]